MGGATPKAFLGLGGTPLAIYSLRTLSRIPALSSVVLVVSADQQASATQIVRDYGPWPSPVQVVRGGAERQDSVAAGLKAVPPDTGLVLVHDAARPFASLRSVRACVDAAATHGAAILAVAAHDTVKLADPNAVIVETLDRRCVWLAQTPQVFHSELLRDAYNQAQRDGFVGTDDAALVERLGHPVHIVPGEASNRKITTPEDLRWAEWYLQAHEVASHSG